MSDNAELIVRLRSPSGIGEPLDHAAMCEAADALERAEREHEERLDALETEITALRNDAERDERDLRATAASEAAMREALGFFLADERFQVSVGGNPNVVERMLEQARGALSTPASALAQRYEAVVTAARKRHDAISARMAFMATQHMPGLARTHVEYDRAVREAEIELKLSLSDLDHPTPAKDTGA